MSAKNGKSRDSEFEDLANQALFVERQFSLIKKVIQMNKPVVVHIEAKKRPNQNLRDETARIGTYIEEAGSGVVIQHQSKFYILTNYHVIENSSVDDIRIEANGKWFYPTRIVHDKETDLSILYTDRNDLISAKIGDSNDCEIGDFVVAVGSPFGLSHSVSYGIISAKGRRDLELGPQGVKFQDFIQTDAAINPGNSGGPLINLRGEVIGINTAIASNSGGSDGIGFSIPSEMAIKIATDLIRYGEVQRGFLGVSLDARFSPMRAMSLGLKRPHGARVSAISPDSPASKSPIAIGDIVLEFNGIEIANDSHLVTEVSLTRIGKQVPMKVFRAGRIQEIAVTIGSRARKVSK
ncbi:MAG: trypsin-like peptidase domain-containing protein [Planctomycetota bacterium]